MARTDSHRTHVEAHAADTVSTGKHRSFNRQAQKFQRASTEDVQQLQVTPFLFHKLTVSLETDLPGLSLPAKSVSSLLR